MEIKLFDSERKVMEALWECGALPAGQIAKILKTETGWLNKSADHQYASLLVPTVVLTKDNYQEYFEWADTYTGIDQYKYHYNGTAYPSRVEVPAYYGG